MQIGVVAVAGNDRGSRIIYFKLIAIKRISSDRRGEERVAPNVREITKIQHMIVSSARQKQYLIKNESARYWCRSARNHAARLFQFKPVPPKTNLFRMI